MIIINITIGEASFFLRTKFQYRYSCLSDCFLWTMSRDAYSEMEDADSKLCLLIQHVLLKSLSLTQNKLINEWMYDDDDDNDRHNNNRLFLYSIFYIYYFYNLKIMWLQKLIQYHIWHLCWLDDDDDDDTLDNIAISLFDVLIAVYMLLIWARRC